MKKIMLIKGNVNDGDYVTSEKEIGAKYFTEEDFENVKRIYSVLKENNIRWKDSYEQSVETLFEIYEELFTTKGITLDDLELFDNYLPCGENGNDIHTIESIRILTISNEEIL